VDEERLVGAAVVLKRTAHAGATWTIAVPADGRDHTEELREAKRQALAIWDELEATLPEGRSARRTRGVASV